MSITNVAIMCCAAPTPPTSKLEHIGSLFGAVEFNITTALNANNHIMGVRSWVPPAGVCGDVDCRAHDHDNLWLPGGGPMVSQRRQQHADDGCPRSQSADAIAKSLRHA